MPERTQRPQTTPRTEPPADCPLTSRELEILRLMAHEGLMREGIAERLGLKSSTVRSHVSNAYRKLGVTTAPQAIVVCFNAGWLDPSTTQVDDPLRFGDRTVTSAQQLYLAAFDQHLAAGDDEGELARVKTLSDAALGGLRSSPGRSLASRDWLDRVIDAMAAMSGQSGDNEQRAA